MSDEEKRKAFLEDLVAVCRKHNMSLSHEDGHGNFLVVDGVQPFLVKWLLGAQPDRSPE